MLIKYTTLSKLWAALRQNLGLENSWDKAYELWLDVNAHHFLSVASNSVSLPSVELGTRWYTPTHCGHFLNLWELENIMLLKYQLGVENWFGRAADGQEGWTKPSWKG